MFVNQHLLMNKCLLITLLMIPNLNQHFTSQNTQMNNNVHFSTSQINRKEF